MPARNPWLADSVFPISHGNPAATDAVAHAGPTTGWPLSIADVRMVPNVYTSNATVKTASDATVVMASGVDGIRNINMSGESFALVSFLPYPDLEALSEQATPSRLRPRWPRPTPPSARRTTRRSSRCPRRWLKRSADE